MKMHRKRYPRLVAVALAVLTVGLFLAACGTSTPSSQDVERRVEELEKKVTALETERVERLEQFHPTPIPTSLTEQEREEWQAAWELQNVQTACDLLIADLALSVVSDPVDIPTDNMRMFPSASLRLYPYYMRVQRTRYLYTIDEELPCLVTQHDPPSQEVLEAQRTAAAIAAIAAERQNVQMAMELFMANTSASAVTAMAAPGTSDFALSDPALYPTYLRQNPTTCLYSWTTTGLVTQESC